ncbi:MAG: hypothetical protein ACRBFS_07350 [Aureispira sp.]
MIKLPVITIDEVKFPTFRLGKGNWISLALPSGPHTHQLLGAYCKHLKFHSRQGIFENKKAFHWLNLTHTNTLFSRNQTVQELIEKQEGIDPHLLTQYVQEELELDLNRRIKYVDGTRRVAFLYALQKKEADIITISMAGLEPWGVRKIRKALQEDQKQNIVVEFCSAVSRRYNIAKESTLVKLVRGEEKSLSF